ncbi:MAG: ACT domain-containing protein [Actinomycetota bacterium]|nr:ACT domain-containing protein [Actinomycetota bacterium]
MLEEIIVSVPDERGILADLGELLGARGVNIETLSASIHNGQGVIHLVVDDGEDAAATLKSEGYEIAGSRDVLEVTLDDRPGELGRYCRRLADSGIHIASAYVARRSAGETEVILAVDDLDQARKA